MTLYRKRITENLVVMVIGALALTTGAIGAFFTEHPHAPALGLLALGLVSFGSGLWGIASGRTIWAKQIVVPLDNQVYTIEADLARGSTLSRLVLIFAQSTGLYRGEIRLLQSSEERVIFILPRRREFYSRRLRLSNASLLRSPRELVHVWKSGSGAVTGFKLRFRLEGNISDPVLASNLNVREKCEIHVVVKGKTKSLAVP